METCYALPTSTMFPLLCVAQAPLQMRLYNLLGTQWTVCFLKLTQFTFKIYNIKMIKIYNNYYSPFIHLKAHATLHTTRAQFTVLHITRRARIHTHTTRTAREHACNSQTRKRAFTLRFPMHYCCSFLLYLYLCFVLSIKSLIILLNLVPAG